MKYKKTVWIINQYGSTPETGAGGRHYYFAKELVKQGYKVYEIASATDHLFHTQPKLQGDISFEKVVDGFTFVWVKMPPYAEAHSKQRAINWFLFPWKIQKLIKLIDDKPDAILCSSPSLITFLGAQRLAKKYKARLVFEVRDIWPLTLCELGGFSPKHPFIRFMQWIEKKAYTESDKVVSNLKNSVDHMVQHGLKREKFTWIANGFSLDEVNQKVNLSAASLAQLPKDKFIIGYTGTIGVANSLDTLLLAAEKLKKHEEIAFVIVGRGKEKEKLITQVEELNLKSVSFVDSIPKIQIQSMLKYFDACFIGLTKDPLFRFGVSPNKLFDYLYSGKPILYAIESGEYRPVTASAAGLQVAPENPEELANSILKLYQLTAQERQEMGENGRKAAIEQYEYGMLAQKMAKVLFDD
ncbi:glycosyl transferase family 1 [Thiopseudomonas alkaliphila]|uniref:glycosyltransferase family 4 protein n=1 Tax=Thiopseudomonas alkaliphila TaxID=1697053 RepID=UPI00069D4FFF|nr:glycosyltransferase family 4 protein [Thiopseudomonas alkaliphila]AKX46111.1 glycosyl transferase family 1 [Thiopseudomonas alkaliphila]